MSTAIVDDVLTFSTAEAAAAVGASYRQLDYWLRNGFVVIGDEARPGSGFTRRWTVGEVERLAAVVAAKRAAESTLSAFATGKLWERV